MRGLIILSEGRSGTNWLGSLLKDTGSMGNPGEWLDTSKLSEKPANIDEYLNAVVSRSCTSNGRFVVNIFPRHMTWVEMQYQADAIQELQRRHEITLVRLNRRDRILQAISLGRGQMTKSWTSKEAPEMPETYDFDRFAQAYFFLGRSSAFWDDYLCLRNCQHATFTYEDLIGSPEPFLRYCCKCMDVEMPQSFKTDLKIQRDEKTQEWAKRFSDEAVCGPLVPASFERSAPRTLRNLKRFLNGEVLLKT